MRKVLRHEGLGGEAGQYLKVEAARSECEGDGASDVEALFASYEEVKPPNILAAGTG
ncbi:hypothetical protein [Bacillus cereus]|uniref:hypothetical protein n=1 Tax=Bacillus cereus TaxID=1396 RepID=UPI001596D506|nr:hypothetical protein [Bacillus cereus]